MRFNQWFHKQPKNVVTRERMSSELQSLTEFLEMEVNGDKACNSFNAK